MIIDEVVEQFPVTRERVKAVLEFGARSDLAGKGDHDPPHFHAEYAENRAVISIETLAILGGRLPPRALG